MRIIAYYHDYSLTTLRRMIAPLSVLSTRGHQCFFQHTDSLKYIETANYHYILLSDWTWHGTLPPAQGIYLYDLSDPTLLHDAGCLNVIGQCHAVTVPSEGLARIVKPFRSHVRAIPSLVHSETFLQTPRINTDTPLIGCLGDHDWEMIAEPLQKALSQLPSSVLVVTDSEWLSEQLGDRARYISLDTRTYPQLARSIFLALLPRAKDDRDPVWYYELGLCGVPSIASPAYREHISHQDTGWIANTSEQWTEAIVQLYRQDRVRSRLANEALAHAREHTAVRQADAWLRSIQKIA